MISFAKVTKSAYNALTPVLNRLYLIEDTGELLFNGKTYNGEDGSRDWLCFTALQANSTVNFNRVNEIPNETSFEVSTDGINWTSYTWSDGTGTTITLTNIGDKVYFRGDNNVPLSYWYNSQSRYHNFATTGSLACSGNIMSLFDKNCKRNDIPTDSEHGGTGLVSLFKNAGIVTPPRLPATEVCTDCYNDMFDGSSIVVAPELPAMTLFRNSYAYMFQSCQYLSKPPKLPALTLGEGCYKMMFRYCTSLTSAPDLPATTLATLCYQEMFNGCNNLVDSPSILLATTVPDQAYQKMFYGCTNLRTAPIIKATTVSTEGCAEMFKNCTNVNIPKNIISSVTTLNGAYNFASMFQDCKAMYEAPDIPNITLKPFCFYYMFAGNPIEKAPALPATTLAESCYQDMFMWCLLLKEAPALPATTGVVGCYREMFYHCIALQKCEIGLTTLAYESCRDMFKESTSVSFLKVAFTDWNSANSATYWWLGNASNNERCLFVCPTALDVSTRGVSNVPSSWNICRYDGTQGYVTPNSETSYNYVYSIPYNGQLYVTQGSQLLMTNVNSDCTFNAVCGTNSPFGYRELYIWHQSGTISEGTNMTFEDDISDTGYYYTCIVKFFNGKAKLYVINKSTTF